MSGDRSDSPIARPQRLTLKMVRSAALAGGVMGQLIDRALGPGHAQQMIGFLQRMLRRTPRPRPVRRDLGRSTNESALDRLLVGRSKQEVHRKLGPPRNATLAGVAPAAPPGMPLFWLATTWYYPFDSARRTAMAIHFAGDIVRRIELIRTAGDTTG